MKVDPLLACDFYKVGHQSMYCDGLEMIFSNLTPRKSRNPNIQEIVFFGLQYFVKEYLIKQWNENFFSKPKDEVIGRYKRRIETSLGKDAISYEHLEALHDLGYLPICIKSIPEGSRVSIRNAMMVIFNTHPRFGWLTNYLESVLSCILWGPCTSATIAAEYRKILNRYADETVGNRDFVQWQGHDFSFRGMYGMEAAQLSGAAHLLSFTGTDTIPAIDFLEEYYGADCEKELIGGSVPATEHSICSITSACFDEFKYFESLITEKYPNGIISIVSDTFDYWNVITDFLPRLKDKILARNGKVVIRPDSGDPVKIICGDPDAEKGSPEHKGSIECMWEIFKGTITEKGYKLLNSHIGLIYGDSITLDRCYEICERLKQKGFSSFNFVLGIGSYTYQYVTRDTFGFAVKATYGIVNGKTFDIFKAPKTDDGTKNSAKGLIASYKSNGLYCMKDGATWDEVNNCGFLTIFEDGKLLKDWTLSEIRANLWRVS